VAVIHGPAEIDFPPASEAMVNIRATLALAETKSVIGAETRRALEAFGKRLFFADRNWPALLAGEAEHDVGGPELAALGDWLPEGRVDQKRLDALEMLAAMRASPAAGEPASPTIHFEWTNFWDAFVARSEMSASAPATKDQRILDELRLQGPEVYRQVESKALLRMVATNGAARPRKASRDEARTTLKRLRERFGLYARADLDRWMAANDLNAQALEALIDEEAAIEALRARAGRAIEARLIDELRLSGAYPDLADRAVRKEAAIAASGQPDSRAPAGIRSPTLRLWYFETRLGRPAPDDIADYAAWAGFADASALDAAIDREWLFLRQKPQD
jgi:TfuA-like protein